MADGKYTPVARVMGRIAWERGIDAGPYYIADHMKEWAEENGWDGRVPARSTFADYFRGAAKMPSDVMNPPLKRRACPWTNPRTHE